MKRFASEISYVWSTAVSDYYHFKHLLDSIDLMLENKINEEIAPIEDEIDALIKQIDNTTKPEYQLVQNVHLNILKSQKSQFADWKHTIFASIFLKNYGDFEAKFDQLCDIIRRNKNLKLAVSDLRDRGIRRSRKFLEKVAEVELTVPDEKWNELYKANLIRNLLIHNSGIVRRNEDGTFQDTELGSYISSRNDIILANNVRIIITKEYLSNTRMLFYNLLLNFYEDVNEVWSE